MRVIYIVSSIHSVFADSWSSSTPADRSHIEVNSPENSTDYIKSIKGDTLCLIFMFPYFI